MHSAPAGVPTVPCLWWVSFVPAVIASHLNFGGLAEFVCSLPTTLSRFAKIPVTKSTSYQVFSRILSMQDADALCTLHLGM